MNPSILYFLLAGILMISLMLIGYSFTLTNIVLAIVPLGFLLFFVIMISREKRRQKRDKGPEDQA